MPPVLHKESKFALKPRFMRSFPQPMVQDINDLSYAREVMSEDITVRFKPFCTLHPHRPKGSLRDGC